MKYIVKCLSGELFVFDDIKDTKNTQNIKNTQIRSQLSSELNVLPCYLHFSTEITKEDRDYGITHYAWISVNLVKIEMKSIYLYHINLDFLKTCKNRSILSYFLNIFKETENPVLHTLFANPCDLIVDYLLLSNGIKKIKNMDSLFENPSDLIVDYLLENNMVDDEFIYCNPNKKMIEFTLQHIKHKHYKKNNFLSYLTFLSFLFKQDDRDLFYLVKDEILEYIPKLDGKNRYFEEFLLELKNDENPEYLEYIIKYSDRPELLQRYIDYVERENKKQDEYDYVSYRYFFSHFFLENPHDLIVQWIIQNIDKMGQQSFLCKNPNDCMVHYFLDRPEQIVFPEWLCNSNELAIDYSLEWLKKNTERTSIRNSLYIDYILLNKNPRLFLTVFNQQEIYRVYFFPYVKEQFLLSYLSAFEDINVEISALLSK